MTHFYVSRKWSTGEFKIICTGKYQAFEMPEKYYRSLIQRQVTTTPAKVTCPDCLEKLIPRERAKLEQMERALERAKAVPSESKSP